MFRLFRRGSKDTPTSDEPPATEEVPVYRQICRRLHQAYMDSQDGRFGRDDYLELKLHMLKQAVKDARDRGEGKDLVRIMETLRLACAINDVELESVRQHFRD